MTRSNAQQIKFRPSDAEKIRGMLAAKESLSGRIREALTKFADGRPGKPKPKEIYSERVTVFVDDGIMRRAAQRASTEKRPLGQAVAEIIFADEESSE